MPACELNPFASQSVAHTVDGPTKNRNRTKPYPCSTKSQLRPARTPPGAGEAAGGAIGWLSCLCPLPVRYARPLVATLAGATCTLLWSVCAAWLMVGGGGSPRTSLPMPVTTTALDCAAFGRNDAHMPTGHAVDRWPHSPHLGDSHSLMRRRGGQQPERLWSPRPFHLAPACRRTGPSCIASSSARARRCEC